MHGPIQSLQRQGRPFEWVVIELLLHILVALVPDHPWKRCRMIPNPTDEK